MRDMEKLLRDYRLTTAEILYHLPDYPVLLQSFTWQQLDIAPDFPGLMKFLHFWERELEGKLHSVTIASCELITPSRVSYSKGEWLIH